MRFAEFLNSRNTLFRKFSNLFVNVIVISIALNISCLAMAEMTQVIVDIPVNREFVSESEVVSQAELLVTRTITQQFSQNSALTAIEVIVMANRNGEVVPLLETNVSRDEWQGQPMVTAWTRYYSASLELVQRHNAQTVPLIASSTGSRSASGSRTGQISSTTESTYLIDSLVDTGRLRGESAQEILSSID